MPAQSMLHITVPHKLVCMHKWGGVCKMVHRNSNDAFGGTEPSPKGQHIREAKQAAVSLLHPPPVTWIQKGRGEWGKRGSAPAHHTCLLRISSPAPTPSFFSNPRSGPSRRRGEDSLVPCWLKGVGAFVSMSQALGDLGLVLELSYTVYYPHHEQFFIAKAEP